MRVTAQSTPKRKSLDDLIDRYRLPQPIYDTRPTMPDLEDFQRNGGEVITTAFTFPATARILCLPLCGSLDEKSVESIGNIVAGLRGAEA